MSRVLLVDDNESFTFGLERALQRDGLELARAFSGREALEAVAGASWDAVVLDLGLPDLPGLDVLGGILECDPSCPVVVLTCCDHAATAVTALRLGAAHYMTKLAAKSEIAEAIELATHRRRLAANAKPAGGEVIGASAPWSRAMDALRRAASAPRTSVLIRGESGTGKDVAASLLHRWSARAEAPFVSANAACFSASLLESELFGHEVGAFTGASRPRRGLLELATGGVLFLDEIGELPLELQPKLLRVLEGHAFRRVGGEREIRTDVRVVTATNISLDDAVERGRFRLDLFHRLRVVAIDLPPLRDRGEDVLALATHFAQKAASELGRAPCSIDTDALEALRAYPWPGNVRELRNAVESAVVLGDGDAIRTRHLPREIREARRAAVSMRGAAIADARALRSLEEVIQDHVLSAYGQCGKNVTRTAQALGISRLALRRRLKQYGIKANAPREGECA